MADDDQGAPNLEPPKLFGRKRRPEEAVAPEPESDSEPEIEVEVEPEPAAVADPPPAPEPEPEEPTAVLPVSDPTWMFEDPEPDVAPEPPAGAPLFADEFEEVDEPPPSAKVRRARAPRPAKKPKQQKQPKAAKTPKATPARVNASTLPTVTGWVAAAVTGVVIGLLLVGATAGSLQACESVRGTSTCGGVGVPILVVIMAILIAVGGFLLGLFHVPDPGTTSFLAVGMVAVISLLFLLDVLLSLWMLLVIPAISVTMYLLAYWVTTAFVEPVEEPARR